MGTLLAWIFKPSNIIIIGLSVLLALTWSSKQDKKAQLATCQGELGICQRDVAGYQAEMSSANAIIEAMKANIAGIKRQVDEWKQIAAEAQGYADRLLAAAEAKIDCEVYHAENARLADEFVDGFNSRVRRKINRTSAAGDSAASKVLPPTEPSDVDKGNK